MSGLKKHHDRSIEVGLRTKARPTECSKRARPMLEDRKGEVENWTVSQLWRVLDGVLRSMNSSTPPWVVV